MQDTRNNAKREQFEALRAAGQTVRQAATAVGISVSTGHIWSKGDRQGKEKAPVQGNGFVRLIRQSEVGATVELELSGVVIRVPPEFDADSLARLIGVVRRSA